MVGSKNKDLAVTTTTTTVSDLVNDPPKMEDIINQYGQLMGEYSKLDDELWIGEPEPHDDHQALDESNDGVQCQIVPFHENLVDLAQQSDHAGNSVSIGVMMSVDEKSSMKYLLRNQSQISSPVSVLQNKRSYSDNRTAANSQSQHNHSIEHSSLGGPQSLGTTSSAREQKQGFESEQSDYSIGSSSLDDSEESMMAKHQVRTRKISDLLDLNMEPPKKCLHCETSETPQWRTGPMGRKTLCNACGVQYKHGRLFPNYRPLRSPTFDPSLHSNLPKKVQETRMGKTRERPSVPTPEPKKLKEGTSTTDPSLQSNLGNNVQEVKVRYTSERHPHLKPNDKNVEGAPLEATSLLSVLNKKVQDMIMCSTSARDPNITSEPKKAEDMKLVSHNEVQSRADRAKKFGEIREKACDFPSSDSRERNENPDAKEILEHIKPLKTIKKCLHCESTTTPQWREGPMGRNTLCNACGVQYRHGRLFPEYCPLKSPKYDPSVHTHLPKKVHEMRMRNSANSQKPA